MRRVVVNDEIKSQLLSLVNDGCTISISMMIEKLGLRVSETTVGSWLKLMNLTFKMTRNVSLSRNSNQTKPQRKEYVEWYGNLGIQVRYQNLIFVNESPFNLRMLRTYDRALRGVTPNFIVQNSRGENISMILAVSAKGVVHCEAIFQSVKFDIFQTFLKIIHEVVEHDDFIIVMDNVRFHHANQGFYDSFPQKYIIHPPTHRFLIQARRYFL